MNSQLKLTILEQIYLGIITILNPSKVIYERTYKSLIEMINKGFSGSFEDFDIKTPKGQKIRQYYHNSFVFSAAKDFQQVKDMSNFIYNSKGHKSTFKEFRKNADTIFDTYNKQWLKVEMDTAYHISHSANQWHNAWNDRDILPLLEYQTVGDERVRGEHRVLDNIVKNINDSFWDTYYPPNGWSCRCDVISHAKGDKEVTSTGELTYRPSKLFNMNPGKVEYVFNPNTHPYFNVEDRYEVLKKDNFNLPIPNYE